MTIADCIREESIFNVIKNFLKKGYDASFIAKMTELSIKKCKTSSKKSKNLLINIAMKLQTALERKQ